MGISRVMVLYPYLSCHYLTLLIQTGFIVENNLSLYGITLLLSRQYRIILVRGLRSQIFRQNVQIISVHTDVWILIFGQSDGIICKQGVRRELCGVALKSITNLIYFGSGSSVVNK